MHNSDPHQLGPDASGNYWRNISALLKRSSAIRNSLDENSEQYILPAVSGLPRRVSFLQFDFPPPPSAVQENCVCSKLSSRRLKLLASSLQPLEHSCASSLGPIF